MVYMEPNPPAPFPDKEGGVQDTPLLTGEGTGVRFSPISRSVGRGGGGEGNQYATLIDEGNLGA